MKDFAFQCTDCRCYIKGPADFKELKEYLICTDCKKLMVLLGNKVNWTDFCDEAGIQSKEIKTDYIRKAQKHVTDFCLEEISK